MQLNKKKKIPLICKIFDPKCFFHDFVKWTGALPVVVYLRQKRHYINGKKQKGLFRGAAIIVSNHPGFFDPLIAMNAFWMKRCGFIATKDIFKNQFQKNKILLYMMFLIGILRWVIVIHIDLIKNKLMRSSRKMFLKY